MKSILPYLAGLLLVPCLTLTAAPTTNAKPNIIVIVSDDCGYNEFSMQGSKLYSTPRIDSIATNGVKFTNGYVSGAVCSPTRAGLLTGRYQNRFGHEFNIPPVYSEENGLPLSEKTMADGLKSAGYRTIALGKWHLGYAPKFHPLSRGFDDYYGFLQGARSYFPLAKPTNLNELLRDREPQKPEQFDYMTDELGRVAADYIVKNKAHPFFIYLAFNATHSPHDALEADLAKVADESSTRRKLRAMTIAMDRAVGNVLDELKKQSLFDNTLVVFINDNGGTSDNDNTPLRGRKGNTFEGGVRVPFAMQWPAGLPKGKTFDAPTIALDIFPTALAVAGAGKTPGLPLDGVNLIPFLTGKISARPHQTLYWKNGSSWAIRDGDLKLVVGEAKGSKTPALFNLATDLGETKDLAATQPGDVQRMQKLHDEWKRDFPKARWVSTTGPEENDSAADNVRSAKPAAKKSKKAGAPQ